MELEIETPTDETSTDNEFTSCEQNNRYFNTERMSLTVNKKVHINQQIEYLKIQLIELSTEKGILHPETIQLSQELDQLLNQIQSQKLT